MPRFMGFVRMEEGVGTPPQALFDAMDAHIGERAAKGVFLDGGGLYGTEDAVNFVVRDGAVSRVDGPYAEAKEVVGGIYILKATQATALNITGNTTVTGNGVMFYNTGSNYLQNGAGYYDALDGQNVLPAPDSPALCGRTFDVPSCQKRGSSRARS